MASLIDLSGSKIAIGDTNYPATHDDMIDDIQTGVNSGITAANDAEALANATNAGLLTATSTTSLLIEIASKTFTLDQTTDRAYIIGTELKASSDANPNNYMKGVVTSYNTSTEELIINVGTVGGSGTLADWSIGFSASDGLTAIVQDTAPQLGGDLDCNGNQIQEDSYIQAIDGSGSGTLTLNYSDGGMVQYTATGNITTITPSNFVAGAVCSMIIDAVNWGAYTITHPAAWLFDSATAPEYTTSGTDRLLLIKDKDNVYSLTVIALDIAVIP